MQAEVEDVELTVFPEAHALRPDARTHQARIEVQPDARYLSPSVYMLVEAIRIKTSSFQPEQLACNLLVLLRDCGKRVPVLLLSLGRPPPVTVKGQGRKTLPAANEAGLESAYGTIEGIEAFATFTRGARPLRPMALVCAKR